MLDLPAVYESLEGLTMSPKKLIPGALNHVGGSSGIAAVFRVTIELGETSGRIVNGMFGRSTEHKFVYWVLYEEHHVLANS